MYFMTVLLVVSFFAAVFADFFRLLICILMDVFADSSAANSHCFNLTK